MAIVILAAITALCAFNWLNRCVCCAALLLYIQAKNGTPPSDEEMKACLTEAWLRTLRIKRDRNEP